MGTPAGGGGSQGGGDTLLPLPHLGDVRHHMCPRDQHKRHRNTAGCPPGGGGGLWLLLLLLLRTAPLDKSLCSDTRGEKGEEEH